MPSGGSPTRGKHMRTIRSFLLLVSIISLPACAPTIWDKPGTHTGRVQSGHRAMRAHCRGRQARAERQAGRGRRFETEGRHQRVARTSRRRRPADWRSSTLTTAAWNRRGMLQVRPAHLAARAFGPIGPLRRHMSWRPPTSNIIGETQLLTFYGFSNPIRSWSSNRIAPTILTPLLMPLINLAKLPRTG